MSVRHRSRSGPGSAALAGAAVLALLAGVGCGRNEFEDRTARLTIGGDTSTFAVDSCGLDGTTVFLAGRAPGGAVLQAVVGVEDDASTGVLASTGLTVDGGGWIQEAPNSAVLAESIGASGVESWERRGQTGRAPGTITSAVVRGARIQVEGSLEPLDPATGRPIARSADDARRASFRLDARCDESTKG